MKLEHVARTLGRAVAKRSIYILVASLLLVGLALVGARSLRFETAIADMLPADNLAGQHYLGITDKFTTTSSLVVMLEHPDRSTLIAAAEELAELVRDDARLNPLVRNIRVSMDRDFLESWGLLLADTEALEDQLRLLAEPNLLPFLRSLNDTLEDKLADGSEEVERGSGEDELVRTMTGFELFARDLYAALDDNALDAAPVAAALVDDLVFGDRYLVDAQGTTLLMTVSPTFDLGDRRKLSDMTERTRTVSAAVAGRHPGLRVSLTGDVAGEADEEQALGADAFIPSLLAFGAIFILLAFSFRRLRAILFTLLALAVGIILDIGFAALAVGKLNMITSSFGALLVGLGIDFGLHLATRYDEARMEGRSQTEAMADCFAKIFVPVLIGALTTAGAFYSLVLSRSPAFQQFGLIAGTGILTCLLTTFTVLPALLCLFPGQARSDQTRNRAVLTFNAAARAGTFFGRHRAATLSVAVCLCALILPMIPRNRFEYDFRAIGPRDTETQRSEAAINERFRMSTFTSLAMVDSIEEARRLTDKAYGSAFVRSAESIADFIPEVAEQDARLALIARIGQAERRPESHNWDTARAVDLVNEFRRLEWNVIELADLAAASLGEDCLPILKRDAMIGVIRGAERGKPGREVFATLIAALEKAAASADGLARLKALDDAFASALCARVAAMSAIDRHIGADDLPPDILTETRSDDGTGYLVKVTPTNGLYDDATVRQYVQELGEIDPRLTGSLQLGIELSRVTLAEAKKSGLIVALFVLLMTWLGFRSPQLTLVAVLNLGIGVLLMFGIYPLIGKFNIVSILALPLVIGMGIDYGVHFISRWQATVGLATEARLRLVYQDSTKAVCLSALTTFLGFGSLALVASFKAIMDLGTILALGIACCVLPSFTVLPALLSLSARVSRRKATVAEKNITDEVVPAEANSQTTKEASL
ncbi:MAG: hypothetical protein A2087_00115 [Spirochaetes bacterium GWD1_61_31]|nr:MAG: hypothetical protein A2Y37_06790 [Spirochaetes bacterium GWB1_60_80]OHD30782.1 MAG: hypothetical protein A2004_04315 [Spirochaetes bacterium GWC1_61_12]OHD42951.1 MAG: hypothetical protein A2087_00115 [Spirochaetes bacterium GWD1_61_31]OHD46281.1 MAG: hypothetical protein A2Y35_07065 [Spirochaetes bacterium GWE1_60_18]OHD60888.1 MAG: hypothetical protein A2Y32_11810 [Spirochaetes bacterium GWF1_60_12]HAP42856.1 hypothetical protein [Spirochaetaceae bacterium]